MGFNMLEITLSRLAPKTETVKAAAAALDRVLARKETTFPSLVGRDELWAAAKRVGEDLRARFDHVVVCGIGGSSLGGQVVASLAPKSKLSFLENVDGAAFDRLVAGWDLPRTGFLFVSKSGGTIETLASADYIRELLADKGLSISKQSHVMTEAAGNSLGRWAQDNGIPVTLIPPEVGGRYSVLSPVGMVPAAIDGLNVDRFRAGAKRALERKDFVADLMARFHDSFARNEWITVFCFYESLGRLLGAWIQQLWAESLGKKTTWDGQPAPRASTPMSAIGAVDQHSFLQQLMEGAKDKFVVFIRTDAAESGSRKLAKATFAETKVLVSHPLGRLLRAEALATEDALHQSGVSTLTLKTSVLDEEGLGETFMLLQLIVAGLGEMMNINPFDQPGVELGKRLAKDYLQRP